MTKKELIKKALIAQAKKKQIISYDEFARDYNIPIGKGPYQFQTMIDIFNVLCVEGGVKMPMISSFIVKKDKKIPGGGFFKTAFELGKIDSPEENRNFWEKEKEEAFEYWTASENI